MQDMVLGVTSLIFENLEANLDYVENINIFMHHALYLDGMQGL